MSPQGPRVAVVGGGLAGITAALDLAATGAQVTLSEVRPRLGGAAYSVQREGLVLDNGQHVFLRCCTDYRALLQRLGCAGDAALQPRLDIPVLAPGGRTARLRRSAHLPAPLHLSASLARFGLLSVVDRARLAAAMLRLKAVDPDDPAADARSFGDWLAAARQSPAAIEAIWRLITVATINLEPAEASLAQAAYVFRTGLLEDAAAGDIGWSRVPLSQLHDGPARQALATAGVDVRLSTRVQAIEARDGRFIVAAADGLLEADAVVLAVPSNRAGALAPAGALADPTAPERLGRSPILNLHVHYDRPVIAEPFVAAIGSPVSWVFDRTASSGATEGQVLALSISAADATEGLDTDALRERYLPALADLLPAARAARVHRFAAHREHHATFRAAPGQRALRPGPTTALPGFVLAGAWTDTGWPATMEGAVRSGHAAAQALRPTLSAARGQDRVAA